MNRALLRAAGLGAMVDSLDAKKCPICKVDTSSPVFKDELSKKEFGISGMCQSCQDDIFCEPPEEDDNAEEQT